MPRTAAASSIPSYLHPLHHTTCSFSKCSWDSCQVLGFYLSKSLIPVFPSPSQYYCLIPNATSSHSRLLTGPLYPLLLLNNVLSRGSPSDLLKCLSDLTSPLMLLGTLHSLPLLLGKNSLMYPRGPACSGPSWVLSLSYQHLSFNLCPFSSHFAVPALRP
jgi:hypothetical protein